MYFCICIFVKQEVFLEFIIIIVIICHPIIIILFIILLINQWSSVGTQSVFDSFH